MELRPKHLALYRDVDKHLVPVVDAMYVRRGPAGIVFRVGIASIPWDDWNAGNPIEKFVTLG